MLRAVQLNLDVFVFARAFQSPLECLSSCYDGLVTRLPLDCSVAEYQIL